MSAIIGTSPNEHLIDLWQGEVPPQLKTHVVTQYRPGQAVAAAKLLPAQSTENQVNLVQFRPVTGVDAYVDGLRSLIGTIQALTFRGVSYGTILVGDITPREIKNIGIVCGTHPDGTEYAYTPGARVTTTWRLIRLT